MAYNSVMEEISKQMGAENMHDYMEKIVLKMS